MVTSDGQAGHRQSALELGQLRGGRTEHALVERDGGDSSVSVEIQYFGKVEDARLARSPSRSLPSPRDLVVHDLRALLEGLCDCDATERAQGANPHLLLVGRPQTRQAVQ
eukprot:11689977-Heterocapsa_arctica.AAC.1